MGIDIRIHLNFTPTQRRIMRGAVVVGVVVGALGLGLAIAAPHQWKASDPLVAADLNGLGIVTKNGKQYSLGATYCGKTTGVTSGVINDGAIVGYVAAKAKCEVVSDCGMSLSAHMCTGEELIRSQALGMTIAKGWYSNGTYDCSGWRTTINTSNSPGAPLWTEAPNADSCSNANAILCCD